MALQRAHYPVTYDPLVLAYAEALLASSKQGTTNYIHADIRDTGTVLTQAAELLDLTQPVAITMLAILHAIPDSDHPHAIVARLIDAVPSGSYLAVSHGSSDLFGPSLNDYTETMNRKMQQEITLRPRERVARFFDGTDLIEPGLVRAEEWRPEPGPDWSGKSASAMWCAVGRKR